MISDQLLAKFDSIVQNYPVKRSALIPILLTTQEHLGYLSDESIAAIARYLELPEIEVYEVVTFYSMLRQAASRQSIIFRFAPTSLACCLAVRRSSSTCRNDSASRKVRRPATDSFL